jgi:hypothetical protein
MTTLVYQGDFGAIGLFGAVRVVTGIGYRGQLVRVVDDFGTERYGIVDVVVVNRIYPPNKWWRRRSRGYRERSVVVRFGRRGYPG